MAACCFYSSDTGGGGCTATLGVKGRREARRGGERRGESSWVFGIVREPVPCSSDSFDVLPAQSVGDSGAPLITPHYSLSRPVT